MENFSEWFHDILEEANITDSRYPIKGMAVWMPYGFQIRKYTTNLIKEVYDRDHEEVLFPLLVPEAELAKEGLHVKGFEDEVYWVTHGGKTQLNEKLALRPTSETSIYPMYSLWIRSHIDLPLKYYQIVNTFRYETKHTRPLIRVREITTFKEAHTAHASKEEADIQVQEHIENYKEIFDTLGIPYTLTKRPEWDKFPGADYTMAFENITLEKGMYGVPGKNFTQVLEELDGSQNYAGTPFAGLDAYQRQLKRFGIRVSGANCDTVEKFFTSSQSAALFPEYVTRAVRQGMEMASSLPDIAATVTKIDTLDYRTVQTATASDQKIEDPVAEGAAIPETVIKTAGSLVTLHKRGRLIVSSYEALRHHRLDLFTVILRQIGAYIARRQMKDAVDVLLNGDGTNTGITVTALTAAPTYNDLVTLWGKLSDYNFNTILAGTTALQALLKITEFKDAQASLNIKGAGKLITPLGATLIHVPSMDAKKIIALDKNCALEMVQAGDVLTDYDKLIDRQMERAAVSAVAGFAQIYGGAAQGLSY